GAAAGPVRGARAAYRVAAGGGAGGAGCGGGTAERLLPADGSAICAALRNAGMGRGAVHRSNPGTDGSRCPECRVATAEGRPPGAETARRERKGACGMGQTSDEIETHIRSTREDLRANLDELEGRVKSAGDWRSPAASCSPASRPGRPAASGRGMTTLPTQLHAAAICSTFGTTCRAR